MTSARTTISIGMLIAGALVFNYVITVENIPRTSAGATRPSSPIGFLVFANILLLILGCFSKARRSRWSSCRCSYPPRRRSASISCISGWSRS